MTGNGDGGSVRGFGADLGLGFLRAIPVAASIFGYGLVFGVLAGRAGLGYWEIAAMSAFVFAGSAQFAAVNMIASGAAAGQIVVTTLLLNLRHLLMGASLGSHLRSVEPWKLAVLGHFMNDESYAVTIDHFQRHGGSVPYFLGAGLATFVGWFGSSVTAAAVGNVLGDARRFGLDFAFLGTFIGLLVLNLKSREACVAFAAAAGVALAACRIMPGNWHVVLAAAAAAITGSVVEMRATGDTRAHSGHGGRNLPDEG
ncbi:MAG: AzlC family ABC transporter permease [Firmicutes bacterium]|nr:AzlC family ABC transporter permease [Bacillota bacterium]